MGTVGKYVIKAVCITVPILSAFFFFASTSAATLTYVSDRISTSIPSATSTHQIQFTTTVAIPASGKIVITPEGGAFSIPVAFDYTDVDLAVSSGGPYTDRALAASASATEDGVAIVSGSSGSITITLNSSAGISGTETVRIRLGTNAVYGATGDQMLVNAGTANSYRIAIETKNAANVRLDHAKAMIAMVAPVTLSLINQNIPPGRSNGLPSGTIAAGNPTIELSLNTDELATCKYDTDPNIAYGAMSGDLVSVDSYLHTTVVYGHVNNTTYTYYVRCQDIYGTSNTDDYEIEFTLDVPPVSNTSIIQVGASGQGGVGPFSNGSSVLYLASVRFTGWTSPQARVTILKDGRAAGIATARFDGRFDTTLTELERGAYTFLTYATDGASLRSGSFSTTQFVSQGTQNALSEIIMPPTMKLASNTVAPGEDIIVSGAAIPGSTIEVLLTQVGNVSFDPISVFATSSKGVLGVADGSWQARMSTADLEDATYRVRARAALSPLAVSNFTGPLPLGIGGEPVDDLSLRADINKDGKVNLIDFSIMLSFWGSDEDKADMNLDANVDLADFSILLFYWTG